MPMKGIKEEEEMDKPSLRWYHEKPKEWYVEYGIQMILGTLHAYGPFLGTGESQRTFTEHERYFVVFSVR